MRRYVVAGLALLTRPRKMAGRSINIQLDPTSSCNLRCAMCIREDLDEAHKNKNMTLEEFRYIYDLTQPRSINMAATGEPLLNRDFLEMIRYAKKVNHGKIITSTNLTTVNEKIAREIVESRLDILKISVDAATEETYLKIRRRPFFKRIIENTKMISAIKQQIHSDKPQMRFEFVIQKDNYQEMKPLIELSRKIGMNYVFFRVLEVEGLAPGKKMKLLNGIDTVDMQAELEKAYRAAKKLRVRTNLPDLVRDFSSLAFKYGQNSTQRLEREKRGVCLLPWFQIFVSVNGDVSVCCNLGVIEKAYVGNIFRDGYSEVWNGSKMQRLRQIFRERRNYSQFKVCRDCAYPMNFSTLLKWTSLMPSYLLGKPWQIF